MRLIRFLMHTLLRVPYGFRWITGTGAFGRRGARFVPGAIPAGANPLKAALWTHHVKQYHEASCSVASVVAAVNALRSLQGVGGDPIGQLEILERVATGNWKARMSRGGDNGRRGLPLKLLGEVVQSSLEAYAISHAGVDTVAATKGPGLSGAIRSKLLRRLQSFEAQGSGLVIAHFDQGVYVPELNIPHISPVGGFDTVSGEVTVLDVDYDQELPYRISFDTFYRGMASDYHHVFKPFGYGSGGYVYIRLH